MHGNYNEVRFSIRLMSHCKQLKSLWVAGGEVRRRLVTVGAAPIVLMSKSHPILPPCFTKERVAKMLLMLCISIANKIIAVHMVRLGLHHGDECPAEDAIPKFLLGEELWNGPGVDM